MGARVARLPLLPLSVVYEATMRLRAAAYRSGARAVARLPLPAVAVGNLAVGGSGKTPLAAWIARYYVGAGRKPGLLLRGYGGDEALVHRRLVPEAVVVADPDRRAAAERAQAAGADVLVLDDAFQHLGVARDLNIAVFSAESARAPRWALPAGPWREGWQALGRADCIVVTHKRSGIADAETLAARLGARRPDVPVAIAELASGRLEGLDSGAPYPAGTLAGRRVVAAAGIADPQSFAAQLRALGASVQLVAYQDHHPYTPEDLARLVRAAAEADYVVVTEKDAVKLRGRWPGVGQAGGPPEPLVAALDVRWERNGRLLEEALTNVLGVARQVARQGGS